MVIYNDQVIKVIYEKPTANTVNGEETEKLFL